MTLVLVILAASIAAASHFTAIFAIIFHDFFVIFTISYREFRGFLREFDIREVFRARLASLVARELARFARAILIFFLFLFPLFSFYLFYLFFFIYCWFAYANQQVAC